MATTLAVSWDNDIGDAWDRAVTIIPKLVSFLIILLVTFLVAKALAKIVDAILERVGFDRLVERGGVKAALARSKYDASDIVAKLVYYAVLLIGLSMAFGVFGPNPISGYLRSIVAYLPKILVAMLIIVIAAAVAKAVKDLITNMMGGLSYGPLLGTIASAFILVLGVIAALNQLQIATNVVNAVLYAALAAVVGIAVVGVGGGLVRPMQSRWENALGRLEAEAPQMRQQVQAARGTTPATSGVSYTTTQTQMPAYDTDPSASGGGSAQI
jgi:Flp pilus assembly pilin Flp